MPSRDDELRVVERECRNRNGSSQCVTALVLRGTRFADSGTFGDDIVAAPPL